MTPSEVNSIIDSWNVGDQKAFEYWGYSLYGPEYLVLTKKEGDVFEVDYSKSTIEVGPWNKDNIARLLGSDTLKLLNSGNYQTSYKYKKSEGCECGAWATSHPDCHSYWCPKWRSW